MPTTKLSTSISPKGVKFLELCAAMYNKVQLSDEPNGPAQHLNENSEFPKKLFSLIQECSATNQYADEVASSNYVYPGEYKGPKSITEQVKTIAKIFGLDPKEAVEFIKNLPALPEGSEGWFAVPKVSAVAKKQFPSITDSAMKYCEAVKLVHTKLAKSRSFYNYRDGEIVPSKLRQHSRTVDFLEHMEAEQAGDILILAVQYGMKHRGESVRRARETFASNEFGLTSFALGCLALVHPDRYVRWEELDTDCSGDEFSPGAIGSFSGSPDFSFGRAGLRFDTRDVSSASDGFGSVSAFVPQ